MGIMKDTLKVTKNATIRNAISAMGKSKHGLILFVDDRDRLVATLTDGDLRCATLKHLDLDSSVECLVKEQKSLPFKTPVTAGVGTPAHELLRLMTDLCIHHIPIVDDDGQVVDLAVRDELEPGCPKLSHAIIVAGGRGQRLRPLTDETPKPMLPIDGTPMIEHIVARLRESGIGSIRISVGYKCDHIMNYFEDGSKFGVNISYIHEDKPLGTAGFLNNTDISAPTLVINGDVITDINVQLFYAYHRRNSAQMTVAVRPYTIQVPYGVLHMRGVSPFGPSFKCMEVVSLEEKPTLTYFVNAGIYVLEPDVITYVPSGEFFNMTDLIEGMVRDHKRVASFPLYAYWRDVGTLEDYRQVPEDIADGFL